MNFTLIRIWSRDCPKGLLRLQLTKSIKGLHGVDVFFRA